MTFEDQITQAFETLTERLRGDIDQQVRRTAAELAAAAPPERLPGDPANAAPAQMEADRATRARLADGFDAIDRARSLTEILDTLLAVARADATSADIWLIRGRRLHRWRSIGSDDAGNDTPPPPIEEGIPLTISGVAVAVLLTEPATQNSELGTRNVALLTRYASRCLEALTAFKTARALTQRPEADGAHVSPFATGDAEAEEDTSARRYARLLVSEIKLYHEAAVTEGRRDRDLATRLGGEIARARVMYEQRVPPHVRERADYFHDELVRTLANGDSSLLEVRT